MARVLISMNDDFLNNIDKIAEKESRSRSELIREALRTYIDVQNKKKVMTDPITAKSKALLLEELLN